MKLRVLIVMPVVVSLLLLQTGLAAASVGYAPLLPAMSLPVDTDRDGQPDEFDADDDGDGVTDINDPEPLNREVPGTSGPPRPEPGSHGSDIDGDGLADDLDLDADGDTVMDDEDPDPYNPAVPGTSAPLEPEPGTHGSDIDGDGMADDLDLDDDNDGVIDVDDPAPFDASIPGNMPPSPQASPTPPVPPVSEPQASPASTIPASGAPPSVVNVSGSTDGVPPAPAVPVVSALPSTGAGTESHHNLALAASIITSALMTPVVVRRAIRWLA